MEEHIVSNRSTRLFMCCEHVILFAIEIQGLQYTGVPIKQHILKNTSCYDDALDSSGITAEDDLFVSWIDG